MALPTEKADERPRTPLPREGPSRSRGEGLRGVRRLSNWTLAALMVGVGATSALLSRAAMPSPSLSTGTTLGLGTPASGTAGAPSLRTPVTVTTPSGVVISGGSGSAGSSVASTGAGGGRHVVVYGGDT